MVRKLLILFLVGHVSRAFGFCGFYVAKADAGLFNRASQVVLVRNGNRTVLSLFNDYKGELTDFALVIPVPEVLTREQIHVGDRALVERIDAYTAPRLVEFYDPDPCRPAWRLGGGMRAMVKAERAASPDRTRSLGVTIEAKYTVGEYDILILGAKESNGLESWLSENHYHVPKTAAKALEPYIKQGMKFFVAKVNLKEQSKTGFTHLRPLQFAFESPKFMLPIRLGMINAEGPQELIVYAVTPKGRVETTNYRTVKLASGMDVPIYLKAKFGEFYRALFDTAFEKENKKAVFLEYAWNMRSCDPCAADPLSNDELRKLGVFWLNEQSPSQTTKKGVLASQPEVFVSRIHVRYDAEHFPEDLFFQETGDTENFQSRYVLRHPWSEPVTCEEGKKYQESLKQRRTDEAQTLASLTGWKLPDILKNVGEEKSPETKNDSKKKWYDEVFQ